MRAKAAENVADDTRCRPRSSARSCWPLRVATSEHETRRSLEELRKEVADLTVGTEKITRRSLTEEDHRRLIEDALTEVDFSELAGTEGNGR